MGYNPVTNNVLVVSRAGGLNVAVLNGTDGSHVGFLDTTGISGGTFPLSTIRTGSDGALYGANLTLNSASDPFRIYRWANEAAVPELVFSGDPGGGTRYGDNLAVRGSGASTEILAASRSGTVAGVIAPDNGVFSATTINTNAGAGDLGLGVDFDGSVFWGTAAGRSLHEVGFDGTVQRTFSSAVVAAAIAPIGVDSGNRLLAGLRVDNHEVYLYDLATLSEDVLNNPLDIGNLATANDNGNGTGSIVFGNGMLYVLGTNNGVTAFEVIPEPGTYAATLGMIGLFAAGLCRRRSKRKTA